MKQSQHYAKSNFFITSLKYTVFAFIGISLGHLFNRHVLNLGSAYGLKDALSYLFLAFFASLVIVYILKKRAKN